MRILHIYRDALTVGGIPHFTRQLMAAEAAQGNDVMVIASRRAAGSERLLTPENVVSVEVASNPWGGLEARSTTRDFAPDIVHVSGLMIPIQHLWLTAALRTSVPYVVSPHGLLNPLGMATRFGGKRTTPAHLAAKQAYRRFLDLPLLRKAAAVRAECEFEAELALEAGARQAFVVPIGIDVEWCNTSLAAHRAPHDPFTFLHFGRLDIPQKGLDLVLAAAERVRTLSTERQFRIILVGPTVKNSRLELVRSIRDRGLATLVEVRQGVWSPAEKASIWEEADCFLALHRYGGMTRACGEATATGLPSLASRESAWGDWVSLYGMGATAPLAVEPVSQAMAQAIAVQPVHYKQMCRRAFAFARLYTWDQVAKANLRHYARVCSTPRF